MKMVLLQHQLPKVHWQTKKKIQKMGLFVVFVYLKPWFTAPMIPSAAKNDLDLYNGLLKFKKIHTAVSKTTCSVLNRHTWYLTEELIPFSLFNQDIPLETRTLLAKKIYEESVPEEMKIKNQRFLQ